MNWIRPSQVSGERPYLKLLELLEEVASRLKAGEKILLHCAAGIHRTGMFAFAVMRRLGVEHHDAFELLGAHRDSTKQGVGMQNLRTVESRLARCSTRITTPTLTLNPTP